MARWWCIIVQRPGGPFGGVFLGRVLATEGEIRGSLGPYLNIMGNTVTVWGPPPAK